MSERIFVTGHRGLLGSALLRALSGREVITATREELDLRDHAAVSAFLTKQKPAAVIHAAARNGGLLLHKEQPEAMLHDNLAIASNVISAAQEQHIERLLYVSSSCVYAGDSGLPQTEAGATTSIPQGLTAGYALAKRTGITLCDAFHFAGYAWCSIIPCNLYGPNDNYHRDHATVAPGMMRRMHEAALAGAPEFPVWGSGHQTRELLHADDLAAACLLLLETGHPPARVNCSPGADTSMLELASFLKTVTAYPGNIVPDPSKPEGQRRPVLDCTLLRSLGWVPRISLEEGLRTTYAAFQSALTNGTLRA